MYSRLQKVRCLTWLMTRKNRKIDNKVKISPLSAMSIIRIHLCFNLNCQKNQRMSKATNSVMLNFKICIRVPHAYASFRLRRIWRNAMYVSFVIVTFIGIASRFYMPRWKFAFFVISETYPLWTKSSQLFSKENSKSNKKYTKLYSI